MHYILDQRQSKRLDAHSIETMGISGLFLMEQAARSVFQEIQKRFDEKNSILIVVESGNNGGDGLALSRLLKEAGYPVEVYYIHGISHESEAFLEQMRLSLQKDVIIRKELPTEQYYDVIVDGIFGVGLKRAVRGIQERVIKWMNRLSSYKVSLDLPSGIHATTGEVLGTAVEADLTITFGYLKSGLIRYPGHYYVGELLVKDIGFAKESLWHVKPQMVTFGTGEEAQKEAFSYYPKRLADSHKGTFGNVLLIVGSKGMAGAATFAAKAAYECGCGLVRVLTHESNRVVLQMAVPEAVVMTYETLDEAYARLDESWEWADSVLIGSGLGQSETALGLTRAVITYTSEKKGPMPVVLDADACNLLAVHKDIMEQYETLPKEKQNRLTLTPHSMELSRLTGASVSMLHKKRLTLTNRMLRSLHLSDRMIIVAKDARTIVTKGRGLSYINMTGNHGMATAGMGDCLAGMITSFYAQVRRQEKKMKEQLQKHRLKMLPSFTDPYMAAACMAVCFHGLAGDKARKSEGSISMMASDLLDYLPMVLKDYDTLDK